MKRKTGMVSDSRVPSFKLVFSGVEKKSFFLGARCNNNHCVIALNKKSARKLSVALNDWLVPKSAKQS